MSVNYRMQSGDGVHCRCFFFELFVLHRRLHVALIHLYLAGIKRKILVQTVLRIVLFAAFYLRGKLIILLVLWNFLIQIQLEISL